MNRRRLLVTTGAMVLIVSASGAAAAANLGLLNQGTGDPAPGIGQLELQVQPAGAGRRPTGESAIVVTLPSTIDAPSQVEPTIATTEAPSSTERDGVESSGDATSVVGSAVLPASTKRPTATTEKKPVVTTAAEPAGSESTAAHRDPRHRPTTIPPTHGGGDPGGGADD